MTREDPATTESPSDPPADLPPARHPGRGKKAWECPRVLWREPLEGVAVVCSPPGKADVVSCPLGPINS